MRDQYRAWHPIEKKMYQVRGWIEVGSQLCVWCIDEHGVVERFADGVTTLMRAVGPHDKHGKAVYEGDLIRAVLKEWMDPPREVIEEVTVNEEGHLAPFFMRVNCEEDWWKDCLLDGFEVIGNRYEHPDLRK